jgi:insulysin
MTYRSRALSYILCGVWALLIACAGSHKTPSKTSEHTPQKHPLDKSQYRRLVLDNNIKVLLVSDPNFNKSAAAVQVAVGSLADPPQRQGMVHFLEHMLFMGTEKYPEVDDYLKFINENGGRRNAYTDLDHTNYYFDINHEAFEGALDRLAQFFIAPLFTTQYTERELNAVHSEHQKNLENDGWRKWQVQRTLYRQDHPLNGFSSGNLETLGNTDRKELLAFHQKHYSANRLSLVLLGKAPLDSLEAWGRRYFSPVKNHNLPVLAYAPDYLEEKTTFRLITIEPVKDLHSLEIEFPLPSVIGHFESKPTQILSSLIGHEGAGSLLSLLKKEGIATGLSAGSHNVTADIGAFSIDIELTPQGLERYRDVVQLSLAYITMLKKQGAPDYYFHELAAKASLDEIYTNRGEGTGYASSLAGRMLYYPLEVVERIPYIFAKEDPKATERFLSYLRPNNMLVTLQAKGVPTAQTEHFYGTQYAYAEDNAFYQDLLATQAHPDLHLPAPNPFIPKQAAIPQRPQQEGVSPDKILDEEGILLYHSEDYEFLRPKISLQYKLRFPKERMSLRHKVMLDLYTECVKESLNELAYPAAIAGLGYSFNSSYEGVYFTISGFDESAPRLFAEVLQYMQAPNITPERFAALQDRTVRNLQNFSKQDAHLQARFHNDAMTNALVYSHEDRLAVAQSLTLDDINEFAGQLYDKVFIEALAHGNITAADAIKRTRQLTTSLGSQPVAREATFTQGLLEEITGETLLNVKQLEVNNSCFWREYLAADNTPRQLAIARILKGFMREPFFTEMRTKQQLGYIVWAGPSGQRRNAYLYFIIQSGTHPADALETQADAFIATYPDQFRALPAENFSTLKNTAAEELKKKAKSIAEKAGRFNSRAFDFDGDFERDKKALATLDSITQEEVAAFLEKTLSPETRRMRTILAFAKEHQPERELVKSFGDLEEWKASRTYR